MTAYRQRGYMTVIGLVATLFVAFALAGAIVRGDWAPLIPIGLLWAFCMLRLVRAGVYADAQGIRVLNPLRTIEIPWERIVRFSIRKTPNSVAAAFVELVDDDPVPIWGIQARQRTAGARRAPERLVEELNERLAAERQR